MGPVLELTGIERPGERVRCIIASKKQQRSEQEVESGATCRMAERSAARGCAEHPGEAHSCPRAAHSSVPVVIVELVCPTRPHS